MAIAKFEIENSFSTGKEGYDPERDQRERLITHAHQQGHEEGFKAGHAQASAEIEARTAALLEQITGALGALFQDRTALEARLEAESALVAKIIGSKLALSLLKERPEAEVESLIRECLLAGYNQPKIVARVAPGMVESIESRVEEMRMAAGFVGELQIVANEEASEQDCTVEWPNGGMTRNFEGLIQEIDNRIAAYLGTPIETLEESFFPAGALEPDTPNNDTPDNQSEDAIETSVPDEETLEPATEIGQELVADAETDQDKD